MRRGAGRTASMTLCGVLAVACGHDAGSTATTASATASATVSAAAPATAPAHDAQPGHNSGSVPAPIRPLPARGQWSLQYADGVVSVDALAAPREPLLRQLARDAEFALASDGSEWPPLTLRIDAIPLELALPRLVGDLGYDAEWQTRNGGHRLVKLTVGTDRPRAQPGGPDEVDAAAADVSATLERALEAQSAMPPSPEERAAQAALVTDPDPEQRIRAALALEPEGEGLKQLLDMLANDPDPRVRAATTASIENSEEFAAVRALVDALHDPNPEVVVEVIDSLEFAADASIVPDLEPLLGHEDPRVRQRAAEAIDFYGN